MELTRVNDIARRMAMAVLSSEGTEGKRMRADHATLEKLIVAVSKFVTHLERGNLPEEIAKQLPVILRIGQYYSQVGDLAYLVARSQRELSPLTDAGPNDILNRYKARVVEMISATDFNASDFSLHTCEALYTDVENDYQDLKEAILQSGATQRLDLENMTNTLEQLSNIRRMLNQLMKGVRSLDKIRNQLHMSEVENNHAENEPNGNDRQNTSE
jgi:Na+/phosphate symporter